MLTQVTRFYEEALRRELEPEEREALKAYREALEPRPAHQPCWKRGHSRPVQLRLLPAAAN